MGSTLGSGIVSSAADVIGMSVVHGMKRWWSMYVFGTGRRKRRGGEWMRGLGLGFTNPVGSGKCWTCVCVWAAVVWVVYVGSG